MRAVAPLARALISLAEAERSGALRVRSGAHAATLWLSKGVLVSIDGVDGALLGDALLKRGVLDADKHGRALLTRPPSGRVGRWLVEVGAASSEDVQQALDAQLYDRVAALLRWPSPSFSFSPDLLRSDNTTLRGELVVAVWAGMVAIARQLTTEGRVGLAGTSRLRLTRAGESIVSALVRAHHIHAGDALSWLEPTKANPAAGGAASERAVLRALHGALDARVDSESYSLLLRKQREVRRMATPATLLDLPASSDAAAAKRALRRLATKLHPDRFAATEPRLRGVSSEVLRALLDAEATLRAAR